MKNEVIKIRKSLEKILDEKRYEHTLGVEFTATALAMRYGADVYKAQIAGLLHDCAKCYSDSKKIDLCEKYGLPISPVERSNPGLLHAKLGAYLARKEYKISDPEIHDAICYHTTGRPGMSLLEKIVFIADFVEPGRKMGPGVDMDAVRKLAFEDIDLALFRILEDTYSYLQNTGKEIDGHTAETIAFYREELGNS